MRLPVCGLIRKRHTFNLVLRTLGNDPSGGGVEVQEELPGGARVDGLRLPLCGLILSDPSAVSCWARSDVSLGEAEPNFSEIGAAEPSPRSCASQSRG